MTQRTFGDLRVRYDFNPSDNPDVAKIKARTAAVIAQLEEMTANRRGGR